VGFVLNQPDQTSKGPSEQTFEDVLGESVVGAAYENEFFAARVGYRFDGEADGYSANKLNEGARLAYRLEERMLENMVDGMRVWLNGYYYGIGGELLDVPNQGIMGGGEYFTNWLYWLWDTDSFIAKFDACFSIYKAYSNGVDFTPSERLEYMSLEFKPAFYYKLFGNLLQAGLRFGLGMEFGDGKTYQDSPYQYIFVEPQIRFNIGSNTYLALLYCFTDKYVWPYEDIKDSNLIHTGDKSQKHWINLRAVYSF
jgi:hypothetical protein